MTAEAKDYLRKNRYHDTPGWVSKDHSNPIDMEDMAEILEAYHQEQIKKMPKIGQTGFGTTHPFIEQLCIKLFDDCEYLAVKNGRSATVSKHLRQTLCIELNLLGINELEHTDKLKP